MTHGCDRADACVFDPACPHYSGSCEVLDHPDRFTRNDGGMTMDMDQLRQALGRVAYERYVEANDGVLRRHLEGLVFGMPPWESRHGHGELDLAEKEKWVQVAGAVLDTYRMHNIVVPHEVSE